MRKPDQQGGRSLRGNERQGERKRHTRQAESDQRAAMDRLDEDDANESEASVGREPAERSRLPAALIAAYRAAWYRVELPEGAETLRIGAPAPRTQAWLRARGCAGAAFVTACNPHGQRQDEAANAAATARLRAHIEARGWPFLVGAGGDDAGGWAPEPSLLVALDGVARAAELGRMFEQNAVVWLPAEGPARLVLLR